MWPFKSKSLTESEDHRITTLMKWRPIGSRIKYLGVEMVVTGHSHWVPMGNPAPGLSCDYLDAQGIIKTIRFGWRQSCQLMGEQP